MRFAIKIPKFNLDFNLNFNHQKARIDARLQPNWDEKVLQHVDKNKTEQGANHLLIHIDNFPPEDYVKYKELQSSIKDLINDEHKRPNICLDIRGDNRLEDAEGIKAEVGIIGGTGPLSDASGLEKYVEEYLAKYKDLSTMRALVFSFPPMRPEEQFFREKIPHTKRYTDLLINYLATYPADNLILASNTAHSNYTVAQTLLKTPLEHWVNGVVESCTADARQYIGEPGILILGTKAAAEKQLYPNLFKKKQLAAYLPDEADQDNLQRLINAIKQGKVNQANVNGGKTYGLQLVEFIAVSIIEHIDSPSLSHVILSCTEIPMALETKYQGKTYREHLIDRLTEDNVILLDDIQQYKEKKAATGHDASQKDIKPEPETDKLDINDFEMLEVHQNESKPRMIIMVDTELSMVNSLLEIQQVNYEVKEYAGLVNQPLFPKGSTNIPVLVSNPDLAEKKFNHILSSSDSERFIVARKNLLENHWKHFIGDYAKHKQKVLSNEFYLNSLLTGLKK